MTYSAHKVFYVQFACLIASLFVFLLYSFHLSEGLRLFCHTGVVLALLVAAVNFLGVLKPD